MTAPDLPGPVQQFVDAINSADTDGFVAAFTEDGFVDDWVACCVATTACAAGRVRMRSAQARA